jgi:hypothetical protein
MMSTRHFRAGLYVTSKVTASEMFDDSASSGSIRLHAKSRHLVGPLIKNQYRLKHGQGVGMHLDKKLKCL